MGKFIHESGDWPAFDIHMGYVLHLLGEAYKMQGRLAAYLSLTGFDKRDESLLRTLTLDVVNTSYIEGEILDTNVVRSSIARRLGINSGGLTRVTRDVDGIVSVVADATQNYKEPLTEKRILEWHKSLFENVSASHRLEIGKWRSGPMQVVSGPMGKETVHFEAPTADRLNGEMGIFLDWFNTETDQDPLLKAAIAHLWFLTIHPFDDGNGRIARAITDLQLTRFDNDPRRFYSLTTEIKEKRSIYYEVLEKTQRGDKDITEWVHWFLECYVNALKKSELTLHKIVVQTTFWNKHTETPLNERQRLMLNRLFTDFFGVLNSSKWSKMMKCSVDTALRDISDLVAKGILVKNESGGRSTAYILSPEYRVEAEEEIEKM